MLNEDTLRELNGLYARLSCYKNNPPPPTVRNKLVIFKMERRLQELGFDWKAIEWPPPPEPSLPPAIAMRKAA